MSSIIAFNGDINIEKEKPYQNRMSKNYKIINGLLIFIGGIGFIFIMFFTTFYHVIIKNFEYLTLSISIILITLYYIAQSILAIINDSYYIPKLKRNANRLPFVGIQIVGRNESSEIFTSVLSKIKNLSYQK